MIFAQGVSNSLMAKPYHQGREKTTLAADESDKSVFVNATKPEAWLRISSRGNCSQGLL